ncbi:hypothetical protein [Pseudobdellovibrio sp. HCB154]|uniref:hypothetical protein n=1 Tax=Pseudobdellovibrio sp. HCB154 TaxID=3386277 RepID=UPI003917437F
MKRLILFIVATVSVSLAQASADLDLRNADRVSCTTVGRGTFNLVDLQSEKPRYVRSASNLINVLQVEKNTMIYVHPNGSIETLEFGEAQYSDGQLSGYRVKLSEDSGESQTMRCSVF